MLGLARFKTIKLQARSWVGRSWGTRKPLLTPWGKKGFSTRHVDTTASESRLPGGRHQQASHAHRNGRLFTARNPTILVFGYRGRLVLDNGPGAGQVGGLRRVAESLVGKLPTGRGKTMHFHPSSPPLSVSLSQHRAESQSLPALPPLPLRLSADSCHPDNLLISCSRPTSVAETGPSARARAPTQTG